MQQVSPRAYVGPSALSPGGGRRLTECSLSPVPYYLNPSSCLTLAFDTGSTPPRPRRHLSIVCAGFKNFTPAAERMGTILVASRNGPEPSKNGAEKLSQCTGKKALGLMIGSSLATGALT